MANGYYNITHFGNSWRAVDYHHDSNFFYDLPTLGSYFSSDRPYEQDFFYVLLDCSKAREYYEKAMSLSQNKEFKAQCCFMAAKCELNQYYISPYATKDHISPDFRTNFVRMIQDYSSTQFYKEALVECKYFNTFVNNYRVKK